MNEEKMTLAKIEKRISSILHGNYGTSRKDKLKKIMETIEDFVEVNEVKDHQEFNAKLYRNKGYWHVDTELGSIELDTVTEEDLELAFKTRTNQV